MLAQYHNHTLDNTLIQVERLARKYSDDVAIFKNLTPTEFFYVVSKKIRYEPDPEGIERVCRPLVTFQLRSGDCDDKTVVCLAYFFKKNIPCGYSVVREHGKNGFHHIFPFMVLKNKIIDFDATYANNIPYVSRNWAERKNYFMEN